MQINLECVHTISALLAKWVDIGIQQDGEIVVKQHRQGLSMTKSSVERSDIYVLSLPYPQPFMHAYLPRASDEGRTGQISSGQVHL